MLQQTVFRHVRGCIYPYLQHWNLLLLDNLLLKFLFKHATTCHVL